MMLAVCVQLITPYKSVARSTIMWAIKDSTTVVYTLQGDCIIGTISRDNGRGVSVTLAVVVFHCGSVLSYDYCDTSCDKGQHTMCIYKQSPGPLCVEYEPRPLSQEEKEIIVNIHNRMRSDVALGKEMKGEPGPQPQASDMMQMVWDDELARIAQQWADQCTPVHDDCRNVAMFLSGQSLGIREVNGIFPYEIMANMFVPAMFLSGQGLGIREVNGIFPYEIMANMFVPAMFLRGQSLGIKEMNVIFPYEIMVNMFVPAMFRSGQNLGIRGMDKGFPDEIMVNIDEWFNEVSLVQPDTVKQYPGSSTAMVGHYTQLVWSRYLVCRLRGLTLPKGWDMYLVCNYGPAGNVRTEPVYHQGPPCSACPNGTVCSDQYEGLCTLLYNERAMASSGFKLCSPASVGAHHSLMSPSQRLLNHQLCYSRTTGEECKTGINILLPASVA
ncbi:unnamed protein product [Timema podura]|uniref:SCP domain-containing protein n=1 Tax=Timema podura TaxID=61482 RepID=A0ABN7NE39_TIMPD|nr:unnamed protein product [Timema podura]